MFFYDYISRIEKQTYQKQQEFSPFRAGIRPRNEVCSWMRAETENPRPRKADGEKARR